MTFRHTTLLSLACTFAAAGAPKAFNHLQGELDYAKRELPIAARILSKTPTPMGKIAHDGNIHFTLPDISSKARHKASNMLPASLPSMFEMSGCEGDDPFAKDPYEGSFPHRVNRLHISLHGMMVGELSPVSDETFLGDNGFSVQKLQKGSQYYFYLLEKDVHFQKTCIQHPFYEDKNITLTIHADMALKKGWNFVEKRLEAIGEFHDKKRDYHKQIPQKIGFYLAKPDDPKVKWYTQALAKDEDIRLLDKLAALKPLSEAQMIKYLPKKLGELQLKTHEYGNTLPRGNNTQTLHAYYSNTDGTKEMELYISDSAGEPGTLLEAKQIYAMQKAYGKPDGNTPYVAQKRRGGTQLIYQFGDRLVVNAKSKTLDAAQMWKHIQKIPLKKMLDIQH